MTENIISLHSYKKHAFVLLTSCPFCTRTHTATYITLMNVKQSIFVVCILPSSIGKISETQHVEQYLLTHILFSTELSNKPIQYVCAWADVLVCMTRHFHFHPKSINNLWTWFNVKRRKMSRNQFYATKKFFFGFFSIISISFNSSNNNIRETTTKAWKYLLANEM